MLMESEHSMAREEREGSGIEMVFIAMSPGFFGRFFLGRQERENTPNKY
jgi:hypothetical protein